MDDCLGCLVISSAGRDKGCICAVVGYPDEPGFVLIADGKLRKVERPKKKKLRHIRPIENIPEEKRRLAPEKLTNRFIREAVSEVRELLSDISV